MKDPAANRAEIELARMNRALRMLSDSNQALIRMTDEPALLHEVCRIAVEVGGYRMAWVGFPENDERKTVRVGAVKGFERGYLEAQRITWADEPRGRGPTGTAIRTRAPRVVHDVDTDASAAPWRAAAREHGYRSVAALPLICEGRMLGALSIHSAEVDAFNDEEMKILTELAGDLAFGLTALRLREEHAQAEEHIHRSEQEFRAFVENSPDIIVRWNRDCRPVYVNPALASLFGVSASDFIGRQLGSGTRAAGLEPDAGVLAQFGRTIRAVFEHGESTETEMTWPTPQGRRTYTVRLFPERDRSGAVVHVLSIGRDITERRRVEKALREVLRHARTMVMHVEVTAPAGWEQHATDAEWAWLNFRWDACFEDDAVAQEVLPLDLDPGETYHDGWRRAKHVDDRRPMGLVAGGAFLGGAPSWTQEFRAIDRHGRLHWFSQVASITPAGRGRWRVTTVNTDITEQKCAEEAIIAREKQFRALAENTPDFIVRWDREQRRVYVNPAFAAAMGLKPDELLTQAAGSFPPRVPVAPASIDQVRVAIQQVISTQQPTEFLMPWKTIGGDTFHHLRLVPEFDRDGQVATVLGIGRDITAIKQSEEQFRTLTENSPDLIVRVDREHRYLYVNRVIERLTGRSVADHLGRRLGEVAGLLGGPERFRRVRAAIDRVFATGQIGELEASAPLVPGEVVLDGRFVPEFDESGEVASVLILARDVTARKRVEEALRESETRLRLATQATQVGPWDWNLLTNQVHFSAEWKRQLGYEDHEVAGRYEEWESRLHPDDRERVLARVRAYLSGEVPDYEVEFRLRHKDGSWRWIFTRGEMLRDPTGRPVRMIGCHVDMTARKEAQEAVRTSQQAYAALVNTVDGIVWEADAVTFQFTFVSEQAERILGYPIAAWTADTTFWASHLHPDDREAAIAFCVSATQQLRNHDFQYRMIAADGREVWIHDLVTVVAENDRPVKLRGLMVDITKSKRAEQSLLLFRTLIDHASDAIEVIDPVTARFLDVNDIACREHGYTREEFLQLTVPDLEAEIDVSTPERWRENVANIRRLGSVLMAGRHRRKDGSMFPVEINANYVRLDRDYVVSIVRDVSERKRAEDALRESEQRFRQVTESIDEVFWLTDITKGEMVYISPAYEKVWGRSCAGLYASPRSWFEAIHAEDRDRVAEALKQQSAGTYDVEYRIVRPDGAVRWIHDRAFPVKNEAGAVHRIAGVADDITDHRQLEEQFRQAQKMDAIGQLAGGIAHDFNNLLTVVQMQTSLLLSEHRLDRETEQSVRQIMEASTRAANLTRQLLTFSRQQVKKARPLDLGEIVTGTTKLLRRVLGEHIDLESRFAPGLPLVHADPGMMEQVLMNLVINARDAMPRGGRLGIALELVTLDREYVAAHPPAQAGRFVRLSVTDTGEGIAPENLPRIFEPFFTTKEVGKGTGLGLATVFGIVQQHHGWIEVASEVGHGSTFHVFLPPLEGQAREDAVAPAAKARGGTETVLLVEDEAAVRAVAAVALRRNSYRVIEASTAADAMRRWAEAGGKIDLLVTDLVIPGGMSGEKLADELRARKTALRVVYTSGYNSDLAGGQLRFEPGKNFLPKPYPLEDLLAIVRRRLDEA